MSNAGSIGSGASDLLWALKHQVQGPSHGNAAGRSSLAGALVGASGGVGLGGSALLAADTPSAGSAGAASGPGSVRLGPDMLAALLQIQEQASAGAAAPATPPDRHDRGASFAQKLFGAIDSGGDGQISKGELESAFASIGRDPGQADTLFARLDADGDGAVGRNELDRALRHGHHHGGAMDALTSLGGMTSSDSVANADGSTTTTITYANGTKIAITTPAQPAQHDAGAAAGAGAAAASATAAG
jgi:hypothetical protein